MTGSFLALGECMVELAQTGDNLYRRGFAGDTFNTAWYARRLLPADWQVSYGTCLGKDAVSDEMLAFFDAQRINTDSVRRLNDRTVGLYMISLNAGERSFSYWRSQSAARLLAQDVDWLDQVMQGRDFIHFSAITLAILRSDAREPFCRALARARSSGATISFDTNLRPHLWNDETEMKTGLQMGASVADIVLPSFDEERELFGDRTADETLARYAGLGAEVVAVKQGSGPTVIGGNGQEKCIVRSEPVEHVVDTTAAGDSFAAGFLAGLAQDQPVGKAAQNAAKLAARVIQAHGALVPDIFGQT